MTHAIMFNGRNLVDVEGDLTETNIRTAVAKVLEHDYPMDAVRVVLDVSSTSLMAIRCNAVALIKVPRVDGFRSVELYVSPTYRPSLRACFR